MSQSGDKTWAYVESLIGLPETRELDFKEELSSSQKIAKVVAAMTENGGTVVFGIAEDKATGLAVRIEPIDDLSSAEERLSQIIASIEPVPKVQTWAVRDPNQHGHGVLVVDVPPSSDGPHMVDGRFPTRIGTTTRWLSASEVKAKFSGRSTSTTQTPKPSELLADAEFLPGITPDRVRSVHEGYGQLRIAARPHNTDLEHPRSPQLGKFLGRVAAVTRERAVKRLAVYNPPMILSELADWTPAGTTGWIAGRANQSLQRLVTTPTAAAVVAYPWRTTVQITVPTIVDAGGRAPAYLCAHESYLAVQLWATLAFIGELYSDVEPLKLNIAAHLAGFRGAVSQHATHCEEGLHTSHLPTAEHGDSKAMTIGSDELHRAPEGAARKLIERWLVSFYQGDDLMSCILVPSDQGIEIS